jgi:glutamate formiminotransferase/formiminotetrahydrofolate cyclodeaminase
MGWWLDEANMAQCSFNITDSDVTGLHTVFEEVMKMNMLCSKVFQNSINYEAFFTCFLQSKAIAESLNLSVVGSELVGLVPLSSMLDAANYYIKKEKLMILDPDQKVRLAIDRLGLNSLYHFDPK